MKRSSVLRLCEAFDLKGAAPRIAERKDIGPEAEVEVAALDVRAEATFLRRKMVWSRLSNSGVPSIPTSSLSFT